MGTNIKACDLEHSFMKDRITGIEKHFAEISSKLSSYINKLASLRDCGDEVAKSISNFASKENYNQTLRLSFGEFSDVLFAIQEYRDAQIQRIQVKVIQELECYHGVCKKIKADVKKAYDSRVKELKKKNNLENTRSKTPSNWQKIAQAEKEVNQAQEDAMRTTQEMGRLVEWFERKKLEDLKHTFLEFIKIEMIFHAKAIELYSEAYNVLKEIQVEEDLHEFNSHFKAHTLSLDIEDLSPSKSVTAPKVVDEDAEVPSQLSYKPGASKCIQGTPRSIFTLKAPLAHSVTSSSSSENIADPTNANLN